MNYKDEYDDNLPMDSIHKDNGIQLKFKYINMLNFGFLLQRFERYE